MAKLYVVLSLNEKVKVIEAKDKDKLSVREISVEKRKYTTQLNKRIK
jgi:hypothetical protein